MGALVVVVLGALWLSGSSTLHLGTVHGVPPLALPALPIVLEVASVIATALWVTAPDRRMRRRPALVVLLSSSVAAVGGWLAYSWLGLIAPLLTVLVTDMIAERWAGLTARPIPPARAQPTSPDPAPATTTPPLPALDAASETSALPDPDAGSGGDGPADDVIRAWIAARADETGRLPGRDALKRQFSIGTGRAQRLLAEQQSEALTPAT